MSSTCRNGCGSSLLRARSLCGPCYDHAYYVGNHIDFERITHARGDVLAEWELLRQYGLTRRQVAERLDMTLPAFERACARARHTTETPRPASAAAVGGTQ